MITIKIFCRKHPRYQGVMEPTTKEDCACKSLFDIVNMIHPPGLIVETIKPCKGEKDV